MKRWIAFVLVCVLALAAACQSTTPTPMPTTAAATATRLAAPIVLPTFTPVPLTDPALAEFKKQLAEAFATNDPDKLRNTVSFNKWIASIYREGGTIPIDPMRGLKLTQQFIGENNLSTDPERNTYEPNWSQNDARTSLFTLVTPKDGSAPYYAHLLISREPSAWRYTGIVTRIPYYDAPTLAQVRANPAKYADQEFMYVGTYKGNANPPAEAGAAPNDKAFILNTFAGPIWVTMLDAEYVRPLPADLDAQKGQLVRVFGKVKTANGKPYLEVDSLDLVSPADFAHTQGTIQSVDEKARTVTLKPNGSDAANLYLSVDSFIGLPDGARGKIADLKAGQTIDAIGVPQENGTLRVEQLYIAQ